MIWIIVRVGRPDLCLTEFLTYHVPKTFFIFSFVLVIINFHISVRILWD